MIILKYCLWDNMETKLVFLAVVWIKPCLGNREAYLRPRVYMPSKRVNLFLTHTWSYTLTQLSRSPTSICRVASLVAHQTPVKKIRVDCAYSFVSILPRHNGKGSTQLFYLFQELIKTDVLVTYWRNLFKITCQRIAFPFTLNSNMLSKNTREVKCHFTSRSRFLLLYGAIHALTWVCGCMYYIYRLYSSSHRDAIRIILRGDLFMLYPLTAGRQAG